MIRKIMIAVGIALCLTSAVLAVVFLVQTNQSNKEVQIAAEKVSEAIEQNAPNAYQEAAIDTIDVDGVPYIGMIEIPSIGISLPVAAECTSKNLKRSPCVYDGDSFSKLVIAGHNYKQHFTGIKELKAGDQVVIADINGNEHVYEVQEIESIDGGDIEGMLDNSFSLTLFTCDSSGRNRHTVRCTEVLSVIQ